MVNKKRFELAVCGYETVLALATVHPEKVKRLYFTRDRAPYFKSLCRYMAKQKLPYNVVPVEDLERLSGSVHTQGVVAMIEPQEVPPLTKDDIVLWAGKGEHALLLDRVGNANNLGAIVRSAAFFGVRHIVLPRDDSQAFITTSAYRVAQGGMEAVDFRSVTASCEALSLAKGHMIRLGSSLAAKERASEIERIVQGRCAMLVLGNEEKGIGDDVSALCDALVVIPRGKRERGELVMQSLNVAQAASVLMYELTRTSLVTEGAR